MMRGNLRWIAVGVLIALAAILFCSRYRISERGSWDAAWEMSDED